MSFNPDSYFAKRRAECRKQIDDALARLLPVLRDNGVTVVAVHFDGYGDSGQIEAINISFDPVSEEDFEDLDGDEVMPNDRGEAVLGIETGTRPNPLRRPMSQVLKPDPETVSTTVWEDIEDVFYAALETNHAGWEINEGAYGFVMLHVESGEIAIDYNQRIESSEYSRTTL